MKLLDFFQTKKLETIERNYRSDPWGPIQKLLEAWTGDRANVLLHQVDQEQ